MGTSIAQTQEFMSIFAGNQSHYGVTEIGAPDEHGKVAAQCRLEHQPPGIATYTRHLSGEQSIGIMPIDDAGLCSFGAIDIDKYKYDLMDVVRAIYDFHMPIVPFYSKSKHLHLYLFFSDPTPPQEVHNLLQQYARLFACEKNTEIFPKQTARRDSNVYSWINLPYFNAFGDNCRKLISPDNQLMSLDAALAHCKSQRMSYNAHAAAYEGLPYHDAPPCIQTGAILRDIGPGERNNWLFSAGVYLRLRDEQGDTEADLIELNESLNHPLPETELQSTVLQSLAKKTYFYNCSTMRRCDKSRCRKLEFGIDSRFTTGLEYGQLTQYLTDPPYYTWDVNGQRMTFYSEKDIMGQQEFRAQCVRILHIAPRKVPDDRWSSILSKALQNVQVVAAAELGDMTTGSTLQALISEFFSFKRHAETIETVKVGRVFHDKAREEYVFDAQSLLNFIRRNHDFRVYSPIELRVRMQTKGGYQEGTLWRIPTSAVHQTTIDYDQIDMTIKDDGTNEL